ncbi:MAG: UDP-N-acetylmuramoyl-tripeptide--D-alanyl-D-alanine ligase [Oscillospiraceae bacterium]|nr:UDP-N-acetylmuramoyl-tripeptide--D-alanyl-D-alanine ligase [Oscillospiraceae bacterium]
MKTLTLSQINSAVCGVLSSSEYDSVGIDTVCTDSRKISEGCLFIALCGERFDGHDYIDAAYRSGAAAAISHKPVESAMPTITVDDTTEALGRLAAFYKSRMGIKTAAVTGSVGKTSTKEMIYTVLSARYNTLKTEGNLNNQIGLPLTLLKLDSRHRCAVIEMGMSDLGEIGYLSKITKPDIAVITNIGLCHIESLGSQANILRAKMEITKGLADGSPLILCGDDERLWSVETDRLRKIYYGIENQDAHVRAENIKTQEGGMSFDIVYDGGRVKAVIPVIGKHNVLNALASFCVGREMGMTAQEIVGAYADYSGIRQKNRIINGIMIIDDCYNASPHSVKAALSVLMQTVSAGRRIAVLGDMLELGHMSQAAHEDIGKSAAESGIDMLVCSGGESVRMAEAARSHRLETHYFAAKEEASHFLKQTLCPGDTALFKASRGMAFETIIESLQETI